MAEKSCHGFGSTTQVGLTQALAALKRLVAIVFALVAAFVLGLVSGVLWNSDGDFAVDSLVKEAERNVSRLDAIDKKHKPWGIWAGTMPFSSPGDPAVHRPFQLCLITDTGASRVFILEEKTWNELKPGSFKTNRIGPTSILSSLTAGKTLGGGEWVEAWTFSLTQNSADTLVTSGTRVVNNLNNDTADSTFTFQGQALLRRVPGCG
ncbi:hypothetical protein ACW5EG_16985 [Luteimonas sp. A611]